MTKKQEQKQFTKFSPITVETKKNIRDLRLNAGHSMNKGAALLLVSRKQLEDIEAIRNYGCHIDLEVLARVASVYKEDISKIVGKLPRDIDDYLKRPRKRIGSKSRRL